MENPDCSFLEDTKQKNATIKNEDVFYLIVNCMESGICKPSLNSGSNSLTSLQTSFYLEIT